MYLEYKPHTSKRKVSLLEAVVGDRPKSSEDFSTWYYRWHEMIRQAEQARGKLIYDDVRCAVATRQAPRELRERLILQAALVTDRLSAMRDIITSWMTAMKTFGAAG